MQTQMMNALSSTPNPKLSHSEYSIMKRLTVSENKRFLVHEDGTPFFYLGDTAWELFHRCDRDEADLYLRNRAEKGFTVIQAVVLAEENGLHDPNSLGEIPLHDDDPTRPNDKYFEHVDNIVQRAAKLGLVIGMLPTWGDKWNKKWGAGPEVFTSENARVYGEWLGRRYRDHANIIWILGGDRPVENDTHRAIIDAIAEGIAAGDGGSHLKTFHPMGGGTSATYFHDAPWLDFNMWQSGHGRHRDNYVSVAQDYARTPVKPVLDGEPGYEDHKAGFQLQNGFLDHYDVRKSLYWALFAGACGHTYGCHDVWQMWKPGRRGVNHPRLPWTKAIDLPGAGQMQHARKLLESRQYLSRVPDQSLVVAQPQDQEGNEQQFLHVAATRDSEGSYALLYFPADVSVDVDLSKLSGDSIRACWFDPRSGRGTEPETFPRSGTRSFRPPEWGPDWVLVLDDVASSYPIPGTTA
jgi:hypothetical protein